MTDEPTIKTGRIEVKRGARDWNWVIKIKLRRVFIKLWKDNRLKVKCEILGKKYQKMLLKIKPELLNLMENFDKNQKW